MKVGIAVECPECGLRKVPTGRSAPVSLHMCDERCSGYRKPPHVGSLWPSETEEDFGYPVGPHGWREMGREVKS